MEENAKLRNTAWLWILAALGAFIVALILLGRNIPDSSPAVQDNGTAAINRKSRTYSVFYKAGVFSPTNLRVKVGDTVVFYNSGLVPMHIASDNDDRGTAVLVDLNSVNPITPGESYAYTFARVGIFGYRNLNNELERGTVIVRE